jgi:hypothetical protein
LRGEAEGVSGERGAVMVSSARRFQKKRKQSGNKKLMGGPHQSERERKGPRGFSSRAVLLGHWLRAGPVGLVSLFFFASFSYFLFSGLLFEKVKPI